MEENRGQIWAGQLGSLFLKYRYILLVVVVGMLLLCWPQEREGSQPADGAAQLESGFSPEELERRLEQTLSKIEGAGAVSVLLSVGGEVEQVLARDTERSEGRQSSQVVLMGRGSGTEEAVVLSRRYPEFRGALVVCEGGDDPQVKLKLTQAVSALTGLGTARISVCKGG